MRYLLSTGLPLSYHLGLVPHRLMQQEMKIFQSTVCFQVLNSRVISKISFAPNCHCADETLTLLFFMDHPKRRRDIGFLFCLKNVLLCTVTVLNRDNIDTTQEVEACCGQEIIFAVKGAAEQKGLMLFVYSTETLWLCSRETLTGNHGLGFSSGTDFEVHL